MEHFLYKDLVSDADHAFRIGMLFHTILDRPDLAILIKSVKVTDKTKPIVARKASVVDNAYHLLFWNKIITVRDLLETFAQSLDQGIVSRWFGSIYTSPSSFDGTLAAILCLATNLEHLDLKAVRNDLPITTNIIGRNWDTMGQSPDTFPFCNLKSICIRGDVNGTLPVLPWFDTLSNICKFTFYLRDHFLHFPYPCRAIGTNLRALETTNISIGPDEFEKLFSSRDLRNLRELKISGIYVRSGTSWVDYDLQLMIHTFEAYLPGLEVLHWTQHDWMREGVDLGTFRNLKGLPKLRELKVDVHLLEIQRLQASPENYIFEGLEALHVRCLGRRDKRAELILEAARSVGTRSVDLSLELDCDPDAMWF